MCGTCQNVRSTIFSIVSAAFHCVAPCWRSPIGHDEHTMQAESEQMTLALAENKTGYFGVTHNPQTSSKPYQARVTRGGRRVNLGSFATAEEAALSIARTPEGQEAAKRPAAA